MTNVSLIKYLHKKGYRPKLIQIITGYSQSVVSKGIHSERPYIPTINNINEEQAIRKYVVDRFLECRELPVAGFTEQDRVYIKILNYLLVDKEKISKLYYTISQYKINQAIRDKALSVVIFNPYLIDLTDEEFNCFLEKALF